MGLRRRGIILILWAPVAGLQIGRWGFLNGLHRTGTLPIMWVQVADIQECRVGAMSSKGCHGNGYALMKGRGQVVWEVDTKEWGYSEDHTIQVNLVLAQIKEIGVARAVLREAEGRPWYREEGVRRWFLWRSVGSRGVAGRGSAATGPARTPG